MQASLALLLLVSCSASNSGPGTSGEDDGLPDDTATGAGITWRFDAARTGWSRDAAGPEDIASMYREWSYDIEQAIGIDGRDAMDGDLVVAEGLAFLTHELEQDSGDAIWTVHAVDVADGSNRWLTELRYAAGTPAWWGGLLFVSGDDELVALDAVDGAVRWRLAGDFEGSEPAVVDSRLWIPDGEHLLALDPADGATLLSIPADSRGAWYEAPAISEGMVLWCGGEGKELRAYSALDGSLRWTAADGPNRCPVTVSEERVISVVGDRLAAFDLYTGEVAWTASPDVLAEAPTVAADDTAVYLAVDNGVTAVNLQDGEVRWTWTDDESGLAFGTMGIVWSDYAIWPVDTGGNEEIYVFAKETGEFLGRWDSGHPGYLGTPWVLDGRLVVLNGYSGEIYSLY